MKNIPLLCGCLLLAGAALAQTNPIISSWLFNTSGVKARYYLSGNATVHTSTVDVNVQQVQYSTSYAYVKATGVPGYITGPFAIGTTTTANNNNYTVKLPLTPTVATTKTAVDNGPIALFIDGTVAYRARDAASYNNQNQWHQNAVYFENLGFDCAHGHPGPQTADYHVHQNPAAFKVSSVPTSSICNVYLADGLYLPDSTVHSPLIGFAADGYPIYGAYAYSNPTNTASGIKRMHTSYSLRNMSSRTTLPNGTAAAGPSFTQVIPPQLPGSTSLVAVPGAYEEDYEYLAGHGDLDEYNGRFCITPEYPNGMYCYFATIDSHLNPEYPYLIGNYYYGVVAAQSGPPGQGFTHATVSEPVTTYTPVVTGLKINDAGDAGISVFPNPSQDLLVVQLYGANNTDWKVELFDVTGRLVLSDVIRPGSTMCCIRLDTIYEGSYLVKISSSSGCITKRAVVRKDN